MTMGCRRLLNYLPSLLKNRNSRPKLAFVFLIVTVSVYFISTSLSYEEKQQPPPAPLRNDPVMHERRMLNTNEENLESLKAPTTAIPGVPRRTDITKQLGNGDPVPAQVETRDKRNSLVDNSGARLNKPLKQVFQEYDVGRASYDADGRGSLVGRTDDGSNRFNRLDTNNEPREKVKQWETYDYENPNNLLQIHVDRAPEHHEAIGQPWPMPQAYQTEQTTYPVDVDNFRIERPSGSCARVDRAIERYNRHIISKVDLFIPDGSKLFVPNDRRTLTTLQVSMSRQCQAEDLPHEHMSEQYKLTINDDGAELSAQEPWGIIRGLETFSQIIYYSQGHAVINATYIKDFPRFRFRGLMIDTARHYIPIKHLKRTMDAMSYNKLNVLHWHMVDDQSFPFVSKVFPKLSKLGAYSESSVYTQADILGLIDYAADRAIRIVPEFDSPGHTRSWGLGYPKLLTNCSADYFPFGAVNPISNYTYEFMSQFWSEIHGLFPDSMVHVGGDEINYKCWLRLKTIRDFMLKNNMTVDNYDYLTLDGDKLQGYYLKHLLNVMPKDRKKIAWEEAFNAAQIWNVSTDELIINVWKGGDYEWQYTMENVIRHGYKAILSAPWYLNYISYGRDWTKYYEQDPHSFLTYSSGADTYKDYVIGGQVCMWAEFIDESNLEPTLWPRANAPAEKLWSSALMNDWRKAEARFENHRCRMSRRGIRAMPNSGPGSCKGNMKIKPPYDAVQPYY